MIRLLRDYWNLLWMANSIFPDVRSLTRAAINAHGWRIRPASRRRWLACIETRDDELWLWYNDAHGSTHISRYSYVPSRTATVGDGSEQATRLSEWVRGEKE